jgi:Benzoyl-CoA reductase/2-hydroxyglutaryl-CoA dehydratase subunit, BcrC/BadD/HgdB
MPVDVERAGGRANRLRSTATSGRMVTEYWNNLFTARERGQQVLWYNGQKVNVFAQAAGLAWCHGEAYSAMLAARHQEEPAQRAADARGFMGELCSYARTHIGCALMSDTADHVAEAGLVGGPVVHGDLPLPDFTISAYPGCSSGQQWDETLYRLFGRKVPMFNVSIPFLWGNHGDALAGPEWDEALAYVVRQFREMIRFIEEQTRRPFDWDKLSEIMYYIKQAATLRTEAQELCAAVPTPASYWDWIASIAPVNFLPAGPQLVEYFASVKAEIEQRIAAVEGAVTGERYRLYFDGIMNWNNLGLLAKKFASYGAAVIAGRYTHRAFWTKPHLIDPEDPLPGIATHFLLCPLNHSAADLIRFTLEDCRKYHLDGVVFHVSRTCRSMTSPQFLIAQAAQRELGVQTMMFEGDVADASFYDDALVTMRLEAMLEAIDVQRTRVA